MNAAPIQLKAVRTRVVAYSNSYVMHKKIDNIALRHRMRKPQRFAHTTKYINAEHA